MKENLLQFIWKLKLVPFKELKTTNGLPVEIYSVGNQNLNSGPDFLNAKIRIGKQLWVGNVEIHLQSSNWYTHKHETDSNYNSVILHVVWENDLDVFRSSNEAIATLELKNLISQELLTNYNVLFSKTKKWINCEHAIKSQDKFIINNWSERLFFERLESKSKQIETILIKNNYDWEATLFVMLAKNFGLKLNGDAFFEMANSINFKVVQKVVANLFQLEALFFGQANILVEEVDEVYYKELQKEYNYLKIKFKLENLQTCKPQFFRLRPANFPTIRLAQFAYMYATIQNLFSKLIELNELKQFYNLLNLKTSIFWETHYTFSTISKSSTKKITKPFVDLLLINTIIPLKFAYYNSLGKTNTDDIILLSQQIKPEQNTIISKFNDLGILSSNAFQTQSLIQLKNEYCTQQKCLQCAIGKAVLTN